VWVTGCAPVKGGSFSLLVGGGWISFHPLLSLPACVCGEMPGEKVRTPETLVRIFTANFVKSHLRGKWDDTLPLPQAHHTKLRREGPWRRAGAA